MKISSIILRYIIFTIAIALPPVIVFITGNTGYLVPKFWLLFGYISALTLMVIVLVAVVRQKNADLSAQAFLAGTTVKMLACLFFIVVFLRKTPVNRLVFAFDFCYVYFLTIAFEVYNLLRNLRNQNLR